MSSIRAQVVQPPAAAKHSRLVTLSRRALLHDDISSATRATAAATTLTQDDHTLEGAAAGVALIFGAATRSCRTVKAKPGGGGWEVVSGFL